MNNKNSNTNTRLLFVDDDSEVLAINAKYFQQRGFQVSILEEAGNIIPAIRSFHPQCIILDVMMPNMDGFTALEQIRRISNTPVIFLTGRESEDDKIRGLILGADDYIIKPYSLRELEARIQVVLRRYQLTRSSAPAPTNILNLSPLKIDLLAHKVLYKGEEVNLSNTEYQFLLLLARSAGKIFTFEEIGTHLKGSYLESDRKTIMVTASRLRKKLSLYPGLENCIETVWSQGYKFVH